MHLGKTPKVAVGLVILIVVATALLAALWKNTNDYVPPSDIKLAAPQYLTFKGNETMIFLVSAKPGYEGYPFENSRIYGPGSAEIHTDDPCFVINVTVRNDYSPQNPVPRRGIPPELALPTAEVALSAVLYDKNNRTIEATNVTPPLPRWSEEFSNPILSMESGETRSFNMYFSLAGKNVSSFVIVILFLGALPPP